MSKKQYDPLSFVPSPAVVRRKLEETQALAERLKILLDLSERITPSAVDELRRDQPASADLTVA